MDVRGGHDFSSLEFNLISCHSKWMNHRVVYDALMSRAAGRESIDGYVERHHIKPKSLFPQFSKDPANIVRLTAREHFVAHLLLAKIYGGVMSFAANSMSLNGRYGSRAYGWLREEASAFLSKQRTGSGNPNFGKTPSRKSIEKRVASMIGNRGDNAGPLRGRAISQQHRDRISAHQREHGSYWKGRKMSQKVVEAMRIRQTERMKDPKVREQLSKANMGRTVSEEVRNKISSTTKGVKKPPLSDEHKLKLKDANIRSAERRKEKRLSDPKPSNTMLLILVRLSLEDGLSASDISRRDGVNIGTLCYALKNMEMFGWVFFEWKRPPISSMGRTQGVRRHYSLTPEGIAALESAREGS